MAFPLSPLLSVATTATFRFPVKKRRVKTLSMLFFAKKGGRGRNWERQGWVSWEGEIFKMIAKVISERNGGRREEEGRGKGVEGKGKGPTTKWKDKERLNEGGGDLWGRICQ